MLQNKTIVKIFQNPEQNDIRLLQNNRKRYYIAKRILDLSLALFLLILLSPLLLFVAAIIYIYSPGPVIFVQKRTGAKRKSCGEFYYWEQEIFDCYKFRTMKINADPSIHQSYVKALIDNNQEQIDAIQGQETETKKLLNDHRITRPGALLRKFSLDELPQFWNVLLGNMSLVGPRPAIPYEVELYKSWHRSRLEAQPGITGLQQVTSRCAASFDEQVQLDIEYIQKQSLWLDIKIILKTPLAILSTKGAG